MSNSRAYTREMREKHIARKKRIVHQYPYMGEYYDCDGKYSKGKIHCSCGMCRSKTNNKSWRKRKIHGNYAPNHNWKPSDVRKLDRMDYEEKEEDFQCLPPQEMSDEEQDWLVCFIDDVTIDGEPLDGKILDRLIESF